MYVNPACSKTMVARQCSYFPSVEVSPYVNGVSDVVADSSHVFCDGLNTGGF
jgi:hypothetical protein